MPEFRRDVFSGRWVIIAEERAARPSEFATQPPRHMTGRCPFCAGSELDTPEAIAVYPANPDSPHSWQVRVIPNKYPAVVANVPTLTSTPSGVETSLDSIWRPGLGVHEVIIESPEHVASFSDLKPATALTVFRAYQDRLNALSQDPQLQYALLFKNCRGGSGATLEHVHSQLLGTSIIPTEVELELDAANRHFTSTDRCLFCDLMQNELKSTERIAAETSQFVAICPYASRFPYQTWILPRQHSHRFELAHTALLVELADLLLQIVRKFEQLSRDAPYNYWLHTAPFHASTEAMFHWHWELIPRITTQAGYEWGSGCFVNPVAPETAARVLRAE